MDALVAEKVFGWTRLTVFEPRPGETLNHGFPPDGYHPFGAVPPDYSTDISAAWLVVDRLRSQGYGITLSDVRAYFWTCEVDRDTWRGSEVWTAPTAPLAICRAALAAVEAT